MIKFILNVAFCISVLHTNAQLNRVYYHFELGLQPHVQGSAVLHFNNHFSLNAGINYQSINTGYSNLHYGAFSMKTSSAIRTDCIGVHALVGLSTNRNKRFDVAFFAGPVFGRYDHKTNFKKIDSGLDGYRYSYDSKVLYQLGGQGRVDFSFQITKYFGLNAALGTTIFSQFSSFYGTVGIIVGRVQNKK